MNYQELLQESIDKKNSTSIQQMKKLTKLYETVGEELLKEVKKHNKIDRVFLRKYQKVIDTQTQNLKNYLTNLVTNNIKTFSQLGNMVNESIFKSLEDDYGIDVPKEIIASLNSVPTEVANKLISGSLYKDGKGLDERIWECTSKNGKDIQTIIAKSILEKKPYEETIKDLERYLLPSKSKPWNMNKVVPGVSKTMDYNAQRLFRTSINHAFYMSNIESNKKNPFVDSIHWELSGQHSYRQVRRFGEDICDQHANQDSYGLGRGNFPKDNVPIPHPQCLCVQYGVITKSMEQIGQELRDWMAGNKNEMLDNQFGSIPIKNKVKVPSSPSKPSIKESSDSISEPKASITRDYKQYLRSNITELKDYTKAWIDSLSSDEIASIEKYTGSAYNRINGSLRGVYEEHKNERYKKRYEFEIENISKALQKYQLKDDMKVFRGCDSDMLTHYGFDDLYEYIITNKGLPEATERLKSEMVGQVFKDKGYFSTAVLKGSEFNKDFMFTIEIDKEYKGVAFINDLSDFKDSEYEMLIDRDSSMIIKEIEYDKSNECWRIVAKLFRE